jgi:hypothetical protein
MADQESKVPLPQFLKIMTNSGVPVARAMSITGKMLETISYQRTAADSATRYKEYNIPSQLGGLTDSKLAASGLTDKEDRKLVLAAFRKAGYVYKGKTVTKKEAIEKNIASSSDAWPSKLEGTTVATTIVGRLDTILTDVTAHSWLSLPPRNVNASTRATRTNSFLMAPKMSR